ncbi:MAG: acyl carrier protein [Phycisphaerales bacterium]|nr:acyl carrier protein [Phycisphaerales bacterium]MCB9863697.1 acyl carrier protein [Phycisphaerales bacterium]
MKNEERLKAIVSGVLGVGEADIHDSLSSTDVDTWDSLNHINLMTAVEEEFGVRFPTEAMDRLKSVGLIKRDLSSLGIDFGA